MSIRKIFIAEVLIMVTLLVTFCNIPDKNFSFNETDLPVSIPFAGNSYVTEPLGSEFIDNYTGKFKSDWADPDITMST